MKVQFIALTVCSFFLLVGCKKDNKQQPTPTPTPTPVPAPTAVEAVFKFDNNLTDSTGKVTSPATVGVITYTTDHRGNANSALVLNGSSSVTFPAVHLAANLTVAAWVKANARASLQYFVMGMPNPTGFGLFQNIGLEYGLAISIPLTNGAKFAAPDNNWHHIAGTYNGTDIKFYIDGILKSTTNHPGVIIDFNYQLVIGFFNGFFWTGTIDDLRIYTSVLSDAQIGVLAAN